MRFAAANNIPHVSPRNPQAPTARACTHTLTLRRSSLTDTSSFSSSWLAAVLKFAEKDTRAMQDLPSEIAMARAHAWIVALKHHVLSFFSHVHQPATETWCVRSMCQHSIVNNAPLTGQSTQSFSLFSKPSKKPTCSGVPHYPTMFQFSHQPSPSQSHHPKSSRNRPVCHNPLGLLLLPPPLHPRRIPCSAAPQRHSLSPYGPRRSCCQGGYSSHVSLQFPGATPPRACFSHV